MATVASVPDLMVPSPSRPHPRFSQADLDGLSVNMDDAPSTPTGKGSELKSKSGVREFRRSDEYGDMQLLAIKRHKEFPSEEAVSLAIGRREAAPKVEVGLTQQELDKLGWAGDCEDAEEERKPSDPFNSLALDDKLVYVKRSKAYADDLRSVNGDKILSGYLDQDELDAICKAPSGSSTRDCSSESGSDENVTEEDSQEEEEESVYVKKKKERTYLEKPRVAPHTGLCLGFSQMQLDYLTGHDEGDQSNVPEPQTSPHGSALTAIKRAKLFKRDKLEPMMPTAAKMDQAELDALCVNAGENDDDGSVESEPQSSPHGGALTAIKRSKCYNSESRLAAAQIRLESPSLVASMLDPLMPAPKMGTDQAELDALCVDADESETDPESPKLLAKKVEMEEEEAEERQWSPWSSPRRSNASSPRGEHGRSPRSPGHGGA